MQQQAARTWTRAEVAARNSMSAAAVVIDNRVYDVTRFLEEHPGGAGVLLENAGRDASQCFCDVGHSDVALEWREHFFVGDVVAEERRPEAARAPPPPPPPAARASPAALLHAAAPPALLALLATLLYVYVF